MVWLALLLLLNTPSYAVPEAAVLERADALRAEAATARSGTFTGAGGVSLHYEVHTAPKEAAALVFLNGRTENTGKYVELYHDLKERGFTVYTYDHRGHGLSQRLLDDKRKLHV